MGQLPPGTKNKLCRNGEPIIATVTMQRMIEVLRADALATRAEPAWAFNARVGEAAAVIRDLRKHASPGEGGAFRQDASTVAVVSASRFGLSGTSTGALPVSRGVRHRIRRRARHGSHPGRLAHERRRFSGGPGS
jgi:hypothetical protein